MRLYPDTAHDMRQVDGEMWNALLMRSEHKLEQCLRNGANPNSRWTGEGISPARSTPLHFLLTSTHRDQDAHSIRRTRKMLDLLLTNGADPLIKCNEELPFQVAAKYDHPACTLANFKRLTRGIQKEDVDRGVERNHFSLSALAYVFRARTVTWARELIRLGADPWRIQEDGQPCWTHLLRSSAKNIDYNRHPQAAYLASELAKARGSEAVLDIVEREVDLLNAGVARQDSYGGRAMQRLMLWLGKQGELDSDQRDRLVACTGPHGSAPLCELFEQGASPNVTTRSGKPLIWAAIEEDDASMIWQVATHPDADLTVLSENGMDLATFLRSAKNLDIEKETRATCIARVEQQLLDRNTPAQPRGNAGRPRL